MVLIFAEKRDMGKKIAAALDAIHFPDGRVVQFEDLRKYEKDIEALQKKQNFLPIAFEGEEGKVIWGQGHVCSLKQAHDYNPDYKLWSKLPVPFIPEKYEVLPITNTYNPSAGKARMKFFRECFNEADWIINATDFDREGEVIFGYLYEYLKCKKPFKRAHFTSPEKEGVQAGFHPLKEASEIRNMELAGRARSIADADIGYNLTAQYTLLCGEKGVVKSIGRVQTPTLNMIVQRENEIKNFKDKPFWGVQATFETKDREIFVCNHVTGRFEKQEDAEDILENVKGKDGVVASVDVVPRTREVPLLYSLSALQMDANEAYGYTLAQTLETAQWLYDNGYTTYPRSKSRHLTDDMRVLVTQTLNVLEAHPDFAPYITGRKRSYDGRFFDSKKVDSHFAIIPTRTVPTRLNDVQKNIYDLICFSLIRLLYSEAKINQTNILVDVAGEEFKATGSVMRDRGWTVVGDLRMKEVELPDVSEGDIVRGDYTLTTGKTKPPKRYNDKSIASAMIAAGKTVSDKELSKILEYSEGIGTEATRASIIETLVKRKYIERKGRQIIATESGIELIENLPIDEIKSAELTASWEKRLADIASGKEDYDTFVKDIEKLTRQWTLEIANRRKAANPSKAGGGENTDYICPVCGSAIKKFAWGWGCADYKTGCKFSLNKTILSQSITENDLKAILETGETKKFTGFVSQKTKKKFSSKLALVSGNVQFKFD